MRSKIEGIHLASGSTAFGDTSIPIPARRAGGSKAKRPSTNNRAWSSAPIPQRHGGRRPATYVFHEAGTANRGWRASARDDDHGTAERAYDSTIVHGP
jgi:hypothetical protein